MRYRLVAIGWLATALLAGPLSADRPVTGLKVYISADMEGISGVVDGSQVTEGGSDFAMARKWMAEDVNAVIRGLRAAGATEFVVNDSHGGMRNLLPDLLDPDARLISGTPKPLAMMEGLDDSFDAVVFVGYHAGAGTGRAVLDHSYSGRSVHRIRLNGVEMPEQGLNAAIAGYFGVPVVLVTGDTATTRQTHDLLGGEVATVAVKDSIGRTAAHLLPMAEARRQLTEGAHQGLAARERVRPFRPVPPYRFEIAFLSSAQTEMGELIPGVDRVDARTLAFTTTDFLEGFKLLRVLIALGAAR